MARRSKTGSKPERQIVPPNTQHTTARRRTVAPKPDGECGFTSLMVIGGIDEGGRRVRRGGDATHTIRGLSDLRQLTTDFPEQQEPDQDRAPLESTSYPDSRGAWLTVGENRFRSAAPLVMSTIAPYGVERARGVDHGWETDRVSSGCGAGSRRGGCRLGLPSVAGGG